MENMSLRKSFLGRTLSKARSRREQNRVMDPAVEDVAAADAVVKVEEDIEEDSWGTLCPDLLREIISRVEASQTGWPVRKNVVACAGVCKRWREMTQDVVSASMAKLPTCRITFPSCLKEPGPRNPEQQCLIKRDRKSSTFYLYMARNASFTDKGKFLLAAKKCRHGAHTELIISVDADDISQGTNAYMGKLSSDFLGTNFTIYDSRPPHNGAKPSNSRSTRRFACKQISPQVPAGNFEVGQVSYKFNLLKSRGPRRMVSSLKCSSLEKNATEQPPQGNAKDKKHEPTSNGCTILKNKAPRWHEQLQCWCLNFHGRVTVASVKNFQLVASVDQSQPGGQGDDETVLLQFGKVSDDTFTMDFRQPLSAFQAFAICLTSFGTKLACE